MARLVICDDESHITDILSRFFREKGHDVFGTTKGEDALQHVLNEAVDLVITDLSMKGLSGLDLLKQMKEKALDIPVIITTGNPSHNSAVQALRGGAFDYIVKPFHLEEISERSDRALSAKRVRDENLLYSKLVSLHSISRVFADAESLEDLSAKVIRLGARLTQSEGGWYWASMPDNPSAITGATILFPDPESLELHAFLLGLARAAAEKCEPTITDAPANLSPQPSWYLAQPVEVATAVHGVLLFRRSGPGGKYDTVDLEVFNQLGTTFGLGIRALGLYPKASEPDFSPSGKALDAWARLVGQMVDEHCQGYESKGERVELLGRRLMRELHWPDPQAEPWPLVCRLYDIAKLRVPQKLLEKKKVLSENELDFIHLQTSWACERLSSIPGLGTAARVIEDFQENFDGSGRPRGIKGHAIAPLARLLAVADAYVALISERPFRDALAGFKALDVVKEGAGKRFDPEIVAALAKLRV